MSGRLHGPRINKEAVQRLTLEAGLVANLWSLREEISLRIIIALMLFSPATQSPKTCKNTIPQANKALP
ncbi:unnamed protein product [Arctogadus glacialis]